jgi:hypothetical protein
VISTVELDAATTGSKSRIARMASLSPINRSGTLDVDKVWIGAKKGLADGSPQAWDKVADLRATRTGKPWRPLWSQKVSFFGQYTYVFNFL